MGAAEEVIAGPHLPEGVERQLSAFQRKPFEQLVDRAQVVRVQHELLVADGERGIQPAGGVEDEIGSTQKRGVERGDALLHGLGVGKLRRGEGAAAPQWESDTSRELRGRV